MRFTRMNLALKFAFATMLCLLSTNLLFGAEDFVWLESENPTKVTGIETVNSWEHEYFSGKWYHLSVDADKLDQVAGEAVTLSYDFETSESGPHELWNRVGFEYVRSPFQWRIDDGPWTTASPEDLTIDLMEVGFWCEIAWLKLGDVSLEKGKHSLEIRLEKRKTADGKPERILYASDCICIHKGPFSPYSGVKPNEDHHTEKDKEVAAYSGKRTPSTWLNINPSEVDDPTKTQGAALTYALNGLWEICRDDELLPEPVAQPISRLPNTTRWSAIEVPGDKNTLRPDLQFAHRIWYRTKFELPKGFHDHSGYIEFPQNSLNTTVYVNGKLCGFEKNPFVKFRVDISKAIKPGVNEIYIGIRDAWYARTEKLSDPMKLRKTFNIPKQYFSDGFQDLAYPIWNHPQSGILVTPTLHLLAGPVYVDDMFVKPSVKNKELGLEITLKNVSEKDQTVELHCGCRERQASLIDGESEGAPTSHVVSDENFYGYTYMGEEQMPGVSSMHQIHVPNEYAKTFEKKTVTVKANSELLVRLDEEWNDPKLWTPRKPHLYYLSCTVRGTDERKRDYSSWQTCSFGFREWSTDGKDFLLNGVPFHGWADTFDQPTKETWLRFYRDTNQSVMRFWGVNWKGMPPDEAMNFFDENGVVVRRSGIFDGQRIGYNVIENDTDLRAKNKAEDPSREEIKMDLFRNWRDQMLAQVKGERNHPSVMLWSLENEILYINCINLYGGLMDQFEDEVIQTARAVKQLDPTRTSMVDGGGATKRGNPDSAAGDGLDVHADHYVLGDFTAYPDRAYEPNPTGGGRGRWIWDENRPRFIGEDFYVNGYHPSDFAIFGGEEAFSGRTGAKRGVGILYRMLTEGYRWSEYGAWHFWVDQNRASDQYASNAPIAVFCREWDWTFESGANYLERTLRLFNDTQEDKCLRFDFKFTLDGETIKSTFGTESKGGEQNLKAGSSYTFPLGLEIPKLKDGAIRAEGELTLAVSNWDRNAKKWIEVFRDVKAVSVLAPQVPEISGEEQLTVYDPGDSLSTYLSTNKIKYRKIDSLKNLPASEKEILLIGKDALTAADCDTPLLQVFAAKGNRVIVLEQKFPLRYGALPCEMETAQNEGRIGFIENETHPIFRNLKNKDFFTWPDGHLLYRNAYAKPSRGARSLLQCGNRLENAAIVEIPVGSGVMVLSQPLVVEKLTKSAVAKQLLANMLQYAAEYELTYTPVVVCESGLDKNLLNELEAMQVKYEMQPNVGNAILAHSTHWEAETTDGDILLGWDFEKSIVIIPATAENLDYLVRDSYAVTHFLAAGGTILLHGLTPEGLETFNKLVDVEHVIRPFTRERVAFPVKRHPLTQGLSLSDIAMSSGERMFGWANDEYVSSDCYTYVLDLDDIAPFARYENDFVKMMSNGMVSADGWPYIVNVPAPKEPPLDFKLSFPKEFEIEELTWTGNTFYYPVTKIGLCFDENRDKKAVFDVQPNTEPQSFALESPIKGKELTLSLMEWTVLPDKNQVTGLDNIVLKPKRSDEFYCKVKPLLNIGAIVEYAPQDYPGRIVLCNLNFKELESVAANAVKKRNILSTILQNLGAEFTEQKTYTPGMAMRYETIDISKQCNEYRDEKGWFGDKDFTFAAFPRGKQSFLGVPFEIYDFPTSPVPNCIVLKNEDVTGIPVGRKADALFFLHTAKLERRRNEHEIRDGKEFQLARYLVRYVDGETLEIPVLSEIDVEDFKRAEADLKPIRGASLAWVKRYENTDQNAVAYLKQWTNPRPGTAIESIDFLRGTDRVGQAALLGITSALNE